VPLKTSQECMSSTALLVCILFHGKILFLKPGGFNDFPTIVINTNNRNKNIKYTTDNHKTQQGNVNRMLSDHTIYYGSINYDTNNSTT
jgi:hypothetical protein